MMLRDLHYAWPWAFNLAFLAALWAAVLAGLYRWRRNALSESRLLHVHRSRLYETLRSVLYIIAWLCGTAALMQPLANGHYPGEKNAPSVEAKLRRPAHEVILLIDESASMSVPDMHNGQTRFEYVKQLADEVVGDLNGEQVSLYGFTTAFFPHSPPTLDYLFVRLMLNEMTIDEDGSTGTDYIQALAALRDRFSLMPVQTLKTIILFSDGGDTSIEGAVSEKKSELLNALMQLIDELLRLNVRLYTVGMGSIQGGIIPGVAFEGSPVTSELNESLLKQMANVGHGKYLSANDHTVIDEAYLLAEEINGLSSGSQGQDISNSVAIGHENLVYDHYFQVPLAGAIIALLFALYMPEVYGKNQWMIILSIGVLPLQAQDIRPVVVLFEASEFSRAVGVLDQMQDKKLKPWQEQVLLYDKGTIYLLQGDWDQALATFNSILQNENTPPLLLTHLKTNLGIAYLEKARQLQLQDPPAYAIISAMQRDAIKLFREAASGEMPNPDAALLEKFAAEELVAANKKSGLLKAPTQVEETFFPLSPDNIYAEIAEEEIRRASAGTELMDPKKILQEIIAEETFAGRILHMSLQADKKDTISKDILKNFQTLTLNTVELFLPAMLELQITGYRHGGKGACQARPWNEVVPLFEKGRQEAKRGLEYIEHGNVKNALQNISRALVAWLQALAILNKPAADPGSPCQSGAESNKQKDSGDMSRSRGSLNQGKGGDDSLRILQELYENDKLPTTNQGIKKEGLRPW